MPPVYPIIPSLSRAPDFVTTRKAEDGTVSDPAESGYVSTRPRFTRIRRTFAVSYKNLVAEDVRVLDQFEISTVQGKAGAFYMPNLAPNGSFEFPATLPGEIVSGWGGGFVPNPPGSLWTLARTPSAHDNFYALTMAASGASLPTAISNESYGNFSCNAPLSVEVGDAVQYTLWASAHFDSAISATVGLGLTCIFGYADGTGVPGFFPIFAPTATIPYAQYSGSFIVPPHGSSALVSCGCYFEASMGAGSGEAYSVSLTMDSFGIAIAKAANPYGRMPGSSSPGSAVRLTKLMEIKDAPKERQFGGGSKLYDASFEVTEV